MKNESFESEGNECLKRFSGKVSLPCAFQVTSCPVSLVAIPRALILARPVTGDMPPKRRRLNEPDLQPIPVGDKTEVFRDKLTNAFRKSLNEALQDLEQENVRAEEKRAGLLAEAYEATAAVKEDARKQAAEDRRALQKDRAALEEEKAAMERTHTFQTNKVNPKP